MLYCILKVIKRVDIAFVGPNQKRVFVTDGQTVDQLLLFQMRCYLDTRNSFDPFLPQALKDLLQSCKVNGVGVVPASRDGYMTSVSWQCLIPSREYRSIWSEHLDGSSEMLSLKMQVPCVFLRSFSSQSMRAPSPLMPKIEPWISITQTMLIYYKLSTHNKFKERSGKTNYGLYLCQ